MRMDILMALIKMYHLNDEQIINFVQFEEMNENDSNSSSDEEINTFGSSKKSVV